MNTPIESNFTYRQCDDHIAIVRRVLFQLFFCSSGSDFACIGEPRIREMP
jgi:hypothetical protein